MTVYFNFCNLLSSKKKNGSWHSFDKPNYMHGSCKVRRVENCPTRGRISTLRPAKVRRVDNWPTGGRLSTLRRSGKCVGSKMGRRPSESRSGEYFSSCYCWCFDAWRAAKAAAQQQEQQQRSITCLFLAAWFGSSAFRLNKETVCRFNPNPGQISLELLFHLIDVQALASWSCEPRGLFLFHGPIGNTRREFCFWLFQNFLKFPKRFFVCFLWNFFFFFFFFLVVYKNFYLLIVG